MSIVRFCSIFAAVMIFAVAGFAAPVEFCAGTSVNGYPGGGATTWVHGGISITSSPGVPACKVKDYDDPDDGIGEVSGLGVAAGTSGEIDPGQSIELDFGGAVSVTDFEIIVFYNGPEFGDPAEIGLLDVVFADLSVQQFYFQAVDNSVNQTDLITDLGGTWTNISPMTENNAGWFAFQNPFGNQLVRSMTFSAQNNPSATNNSDYALKSVQFAPGAEEQIPEPSTYVLMGLGLLGLAAMRRRRKA